MIRKSESKDVDTILNIWLSASVKSHNFIEPDFWQSQVDNMRDVYLPASDVYVYEQNGKVTGFYALYDNTLAAIFVEPALQGQGIGGELLSHAKSQRDELKLTVYKANVQSCYFYQKHGFAVLGEQVDPHTGHTELLMSTV
ncbi:putative acetyltransferase [Rheinheimera pacifica]|uniref:Putative acetyltransferase n=1 Tax=Rheinheimera pacifica TaxID=173990 RepID=A0A1H6KGQ9_9GAMM|nr:N-acetyltransferase [Rheinheimera pacifica]PKM19470.1 MAG: N-acetyltransferase [Gammaproteobacteria bacterium HGW-Gammaproteobacteria-15]SEH74541.1 putative acetyltransferase [Rheinheimera pacifica]